MQTFGQQLINGLSLGSIYALLALGYTMVYGIIKWQIARNNLNEFNDVN
ncbi:High-affinity branched-chain amino acidtransport system permease protein LivH [Lactiplantibacillus plantarum]|nr:High-affinity branched-chain amino acidtransport system permease protein LivH [Lactiplantibacillus plantarum]